MKKDSTRDKKSPKIGIVGSRSWPNREYVENYTAFLIKMTDFVLVSGGCKNSPDKYAEIAFKMFSDQKPMIFPAKWRENGVFNKAAGFERNTTIANESDYLICFYDPSSKSSGCLDTVKKMNSEKFWMVITPDYQYAINPDWKGEDPVVERILSYL